MLGLRRGTVTLSEFDPQWREAFEQYATAIRARTGLPEARVQHVGSTAVEGVPAKPILDVAIGADSPEDIERLASDLVGLGYIDRGFGDGSNGRLLVREVAPEVRIIHVHIVAYQSADWDDYVVFRDALRNDPVLRERYDEVKRALAKRFALDRRSYTKAKASFIGQVISGHLERGRQSND